jgi:hypothetical protein
MSWWKPFQQHRSEALQERLDQLPGRTRAALSRAYEEHGSRQVWLRMVSEAALAFERRWTLAGLRRVDADVAGRLVTQQRLFDSAMEDGTADDAALHGAAMVRGWRKAVEVMEAAGGADDAYVLEQDPRTGLRVAIGESKAVAGPGPACMAVALRPPPLAYRLGGASGGDLAAARCPFAMQEIRV